MLEGKEKELIREMVCRLSMGQLTPAILKKFADMPDDVILGLLKNYKHERLAQIQKQLDMLAAESVKLS